MTISDSDGGGAIGPPAIPQDQPFTLPPGIHLDSALLLGRAAAIAFPDGAVKASTLNTSAVASSWRRSAVAGSSPSAPSWK